MQVSYTLHGRATRVACFFKASKGHVQDSSGVIVGLGSRQRPPRCLLLNVLFVQPASIPGMLPTRCLMAFLFQLGLFPLGSEYTLGCNACTPVLFDCQRRLPNRWKLCGIPVPVSR